MPIARIIFSDGISDTPASAPFSFWRVALIGGAVLSNVGTTIRNLGDEVYAMSAHVLNHSVEQNAFHQEASREMEKLTIGDYLELDSDDDGVYVADTDDYEIEGEE